MAFAAVLAKHIQQSLGIIAGSRINRNFILRQYTSGTTPARQTFKVVRTHDKCERIFGFARLQGVQCPYGIIRGIHPKFYVVHPDTQFRMPRHRHACRLEAPACIQRLGRVLERILRGDDQVCAIKTSIPGQIFEDGLMPYMQGIERSGIYRDSHFERKSSTTFSASAKAAARSSFTST